jgi:lysophospholipase L1-like esterase
VKKIFIKLFTVILPLLISFLVILELLFRFVIPATEIPQDFFDEKNLIFRFDTGSTKEGLCTVGVTAQQRGKWRINNYGWNSPIDYTTKNKKKRIAIYGDSNIEALQVDCDKSYPSVLRKLFYDSVEVYSFGKTGATCSEYLNFCRYSDKYFQPDVLIFNVIINDFYESILKFKPSNIHLLTLSINDSTITENLPRPDYSYSQYKWEKRLIKNSALFRYISQNLSLRIMISYILEPKEKNVNGIYNDDITNAGKDKEIVIRAIDYIFRKIREENLGKRVIFVANLPKYENCTNNSHEQLIKPLKQVMLEYCITYGFEFLDMTSFIAEDYDKNHIEFYSKLDGHWNEYGHNFVGNQLYKYLTHLRKDK